MGFREVVDTFAFASQLCGWRVNGIRVVNEFDFVSGAYVQKREPRKLFALTRSVYNQIHPHLTYMKLSVSTSVTNPYALTGGLDETCPQIIGLPPRITVLLFDRRVVTVVICSRRQLCLVGLLYRNRSGVDDCRLDVSLQLLQSFAEIVAHDDFRHARALSIIRMGSWLRRYLLCKSLDMVDKVFRRTQAVVFEEGIDSW